MAVNLSPIGGVAAQFLDNSGNPLSGGKIFTYAAGTTTPQSSYTSSNGATPHSNPIILDAAGRVPGGEIWLTDGLQYKFLIKTSTDVQIGSYDNIIGINSNFVNYTNSQEFQTATAGQTVFTLTTMVYQPGTNSLSVFVDGVNQYGPGAMYAFQETSDTVVTFTSGLHVGAEVKFSTSAINASSYGDAEQISYTPPFTGSVPTNVELKLAQTVSVKDFGAVGDGIADDTAAFSAALAASACVFVPQGRYCVSAISVPSDTTLQGEGVSSVIVSINTIYSVSDANANGLINTLSAANVSVRNFTIDTNGIYNPTIKIILSNAVNVTGVYMNGLLTSGEIDGYAIHVAGSTDVVIDRCQVKNFLNGVYISKSALASGTLSGDVWVKDSKIWQDDHGLTRAYPTGVYGYWVDKLRVTDCDFSNIKPSSAANPLHTGYGVYEGDGSCAELIVENCRFYDDDGDVLKSRAVFWSTALVARASGCSIYGPFQDGIYGRGITQTVVDCEVHSAAVNGIVLAGFTATSPKESNVVGCTVIGAGESGIIFGDVSTVVTETVSAVSNTVKRCGRAGIWVRYAGYANITGNVVIDCNTSNQTTIDANTGITFFGSRDGLVSGNLVMNIPAGTGKLDYGVGCSTATNRLMVTTDNMIINMDTAPTTNLLSAAPTTGTWAAGTQIHFWAPVAGGAEGVVCTASGTPGTWELFGLVGRVSTATAANIASISNAINTANKFQGKQVWDTTNNRLMVAASGAAGGVWWVADGSASVTPV